MPVDLSSNCDCPHCLNDLQSDSEWNFDLRSRSHDSLPYRSEKKPKPSPNTENLLSQSCSLKLEDRNKEEPVFVPTEKKSSTRFSKKHYLSVSSEDIKKKWKPLAELTIQDLLKEFGDCGKFQPNSMSVGYFRDQVVMKFRRALYYSGIWVKHVQGYKFDKHLSANYFKKNPGSLHRLVPWLKRELTAVYGNYGYTVKNILGAILRHMTEYDLDSGAFIHLLEPYLLQYTHHFLHEFISFVHSPYNMETYDQQAIYQCNPTSTWVQNELGASAPDCFEHEDSALKASQHDTNQSQNTQIQWNSEVWPQSGMKPFPIGHSSLKNTKIPLAPQETAGKIHVCTKDKLQSNDHQGIVSNNNNMILNWATPRKRVPGTSDCKTYTQERKKEGMKLFPGYVQDLQKSERTDNFSIPEISNAVKSHKFTLMEEKAGQKIHFQTEEGEKTNYTNSSPKCFQKWPRGRSLTKCKCRERDSVWRCVSESFSPKRDDRKLSSHRKKRKKCRQPSQFAESGVHFSRRTQRQSKCSNHRSKSWCVGCRKRSTSRELSNLSLDESHGKERCSPNMCCERSKEKNVCGYQANQRTPLQLMKLPSTSRKKPHLPSNYEGIFQPRSNCNSLICPQAVIHKPPTKQEMKARILFPKANNMRYKNSYCQFTDIRSMVELTNEWGNLDNKREMNSHSEYVPIRRREIQKSQNSSLQKRGRVKKEHRRDMAPER
ncbi:uncharacterized protein RHO17_007475 isoform 1-T2 [Thomomys bottae]